MNINFNPPSRFIEHLAHMIYTARENPTRDSLRALKHARRMCKREMRDIKKRRKHGRKHPDRLPEASATPAPRRVQVLNARPGVLEGGALPAGGFHFSPPDPSVVQRLLLPDAPKTADEAAVPEEDVLASLAPDASGSDDVLILAAADKQPES